MFRQHINYKTGSESFLYVPATAAEAYVPGEALSFNAAGTVTKCTGANTPDFVCQEKKTAAAGDFIAVTLVHDQQMLEVPLEAAGTALKVGNKVTVGTDGLTVTATTTSGTFLIQEILGTAAGDLVRGYFKR